MHQARGFTLIELMITVAIIAILASFALPAYNDYVRRSKIQEATTALLGMRVKMEQHYQDNRTYEGACAAGSVARLPTDLKSFDVTCPVLTASTYTLQAAGKDGSDMAGFTYTLDQANQRRTTAAPEGWGEVPKNCWIAKKGGEC